MNFKNTDMKLKRCGYCGIPLDKNCNPLSVGECNDLTKEQLDNAELDHGNCCVNEQEEDRTIIVTRDMAIDAQDMDLEGERWQW
jgi:hypothetical protein